MICDLNGTFGLRHYLYSAALLYFYAPHQHSSLLTPHSRAALPTVFKGRHVPQAHPSPYLILVTLTRPVYIATVIFCLCFPSLVMSCMEYHDFPIAPAKPSFLNNTCIRPEP